MILMVIQEKVKLMLYLCIAKFMAVYIKPIPTLTGKVAEKFEKIARENEKKRGTVDFSREVEMTKRILEKSNLRRFK